MTSKHEGYVTAAAGGVFETTTETWSQNDTFQLIALYKDNQDAYREDESKTHFWAFMQKEMTKLDIIKTTKSIRTKWSNLIRTYKHVVRNKQIKKEPKKFIYYHAMDEILKNESFGSSTVLNVSEYVEHSDEDATVDENVEDNLETDGSRYYHEHDHLDTGSMESCDNFIDNSKHQRVKSRTWKSSYYNNKIDELRDRRLFRQKKLKLAISREERKIRELELKEKKFNLAKMQFELDKRKVNLEERQLDSRLLKDQ